MKKTISILLLFLTSSLLSYGQQDSALSPREADSLARIHYYQGIQKYADSIERDWQSGRLGSGDYQMPFVYYVNGDAPEAGYPLYISMHGGGGATAEANDQQWENQKELYGVVDGVYFVPRSPTTTLRRWSRRRLIR